MKVSVCMATYNKNDCLPNTLCALSRQQAVFSTKLCIVDDCSTEDPEPIIRKFIPKAKYKRLSKHVGFMFSTCQCLDMVEPDTDIIILMSADVIMMQNFAIEELVKNVGEKQIALAEVIDIPIHENAYKNFNNVVDVYLRHWEDHITYRACHVGRIRPNEWLFFLGAIRKRDLEDIGFRHNCCDAVLHQTMRNKLFKPPNLLAYVKGLHQNHPKVWPECPIVEECSFFCSRTAKLKGTQVGGLYSLNANIILERR